MGILKAGLLMLLVAGLALAQVELFYSPVNPAAMAQWGPRNGVYIWNISIWNHSAGPIRISPEAVMVSAPLPIPFLTAEQGQALFAAKMGMNKRARAVKAIEYATMAAAAVGGFGAFSVSAKVVSALASGSVVAGQFSNRLQAGESPPGPITARVLSSPVSLAAGESGTWVMFASQVHQAATQRTQLDAALLR